MTGHVFITDLLYCRCYDVPVVQLQIRMQNIAGGQTNWRWTVLQAYGATCC